MIDLIGVELEGGWKGEPGVAPFQDAKIKKDGSIRSPSWRQTDGTYFHVGEICSPALKQQGLFPWMKAHWPDKVHSLCGFHVHFSMKPYFYNRLADPRFVQLLKEDLVDLNEQFRGAPLWPYDQFVKRLSGDNSYCRDHFAATEQAYSGGDSRYSVVNFCLSKHGTMEVRVFPMFPKAWMGMVSIQATQKAMRKYLKTNHFKPLVITIPATKKVSMKEYYEEVI